METAEGRQVQAGLALRDIRDARLFREHHANFREYVADRWDRTPQWANGCIRFAEIVERMGNLGFHAPHAPVTERQARPMSRLTTNRQLAEVVRRVDQRGGFRRLRARVVREIVDDVLGAPVDVPGAPAESVTTMVIVATGDSAGVMPAADTRILAMLRQMARLARRIAHLGHHAIPTFVATLTPHEADEIRRLIETIVNVLSYLAECIRARFGPEPSSGEMRLFLESGTGPEVSHEDGSGELTP